MRHAFPLFLALFAACGFGGGGEGCLRVHQGEYTFPLKQIVKSSVKVRVTQQGIEELTEKIQALILAFFDADENGHAIIALSDLGLGELTTELGPFEAKVRDLTITLDLAELNVEFVPGSNPPRIRIQVQDADVGLLNGEVAGSIDAGLFVGDAACRLGNGPSGRVAFLSFDLLIDLDVTKDGTLDIEIQSLDVDLHDIDLSVTADCTISECLDGETPPSEAECDECQTLCGTAELVASLANQFQGLLNELVDQMISFLAAELANVLADSLFNGKPLAVEGTLSPEDLLGEVLGYLHGKQDLGLVVRPAGDGLESTPGAAGVDMTLDVGIASQGINECASGDQSDPIFLAEPAPLFPDMASGPDGEALPYEIGLALSEAIVNQTFWALWRSGVLCVDLTTSDVIGISDGKLDLRARHLELLFPGVGGVVDADARVRIRVHPAFSSTDIPSIQFGDGKKESTVSLPLPRLKVAVDAIMEGHNLQLILIEASATLNLSIDSLGEGKLALRVDEIAVEGLEATHNDLFAEAQLDLIVELALDLAVSVLERSVGPIEINVGSMLGSILGDEKFLDVIEAGDLKNSGWLTLLLAIEDAPPEPPGDPIVQGTPHGPGAVLLEPQLPGATEIQYRVDGSAWSRPTVQAGVFHHPRLWLLGEHVVEARLKVRGSRPGLPSEVVRVVTKVAPSPVEPQWVEAPELPSGCLAGSGPTTIPWPWLLMVFVAWGCRRRMARLAALLVLFSTFGCSDGPGAIAAQCTENDHCPSGFLCGSDDRCVAATLCTSDEECCPGAVCFNGWCRPTAQCTDSCDALDTECVDEQCVPSLCTDDSGCSSWSRCVGGRCIRDLPCEGACEQGEACHLSSGRCLEAFSCPQPCPSGSFAAIASDEVPIDPLSCSSAAISCECTEYPAVPAPMPGFEGTLVWVEGKAAVVSYDPRYGDLVYSEFSSEDGSRIDRPIDGVPDSPVHFQSDGYRGGVAAPGHDRGRAPAVVLTQDPDEGTVLDIFYRDLDKRALRYLRFKPDGYKVLRSMELPVGGEAGRFSCLTHDPFTGRLTGLTYVARDELGLETRLVRVGAINTAPATAADWQVETLVARSLPLVADTPCAGECSFTERCVQAPQGDLCVSVLDAAACSAQCPPHSLCQDNPGGEVACYPRIYHPGELEFVGTGLFLSCTAKGNTLAAAWHDADYGTLVASVGSSLGTESIAVDGVLEEPSDVGAHASLAMSGDGRVAIAYQDRYLSDLKLAERSVGGAWESSVVVDGGGTSSHPGGWSTLTFADGEPVILHHDGATARLEILVRGASGCWASALPFESGTYTHGSLAVLGDGSALVSARWVDFTINLVAQHDLVLSKPTLPMCPR